MMDIIDLALTKWFHVERMINFVWCSDSWKLYWRFIWSHKSWLRAHTSVKDVGKRVFSHLSDDFHRATLKCRAILSLVSPKFLASRLILEMLCWACRVHSATCALERAKESPGKDAVGRGHNRQLARTRLQRAPPLGFLKSDWLKIPKALWRLCTHL